MMGQATKLFTGINRCFTDPSFLSNSYWEYVLRTLTGVLCFLYCYSYELFVTASIYALIVILTLRVVHFTVISRYLFLIDMCYFVNLLTIFNYFFPVSEFLLNFGACLSYFIVVSIYLFKLKLNFSNLSEFTGFYFHAIPGFINFPLIVEGKIDFNAIDYSVFFLRASFVFIVYFACYYFFIFFLTYNHWKTSNIVNFYLANLKFHPYASKMRRMSDRKAGLLFYLTYLAINIISLGVFRILMYKPIAISVVFFGSMVNGLVDKRHAKRLR